LKPLKNLSDDRRRPWLGKGGDYTVRSRAYVQNTPRSGYLRRAFPCKTANSASSPALFAQISGFRNNPVKYTDPDGRIVFTVGVGGSASLFGGVQGSAGVAIGFSWEKGLSVGLYASGGPLASSSMKPSAGGGLAVGVTPSAQTVKDIAGSSSGGGIGVGISALRFSGDLSTDEKGNETFSATINLKEPGLPFSTEFHGASSETFVVGGTLSEIKEGIENKLIEGGRAINDAVDSFIYDNYIIPVIEYGP
jgi:hypothetical protein